MGSLKNLLIICAECKSIAINKELNMWLKKEVDSKLYDRYLKIYEGKLSHAYCPECYEEAMRELEEMK